MHRKAGTVKYARRVASFEPCAQDLGLLIVGLR